MTEQPPPFQALTEAMTTIADTFATCAALVINHVVGQIVPAITALYSAIYEQYQQAGAPYGDTQEGCLRWMEELAEAKRLEAQAERIIDHHAGLASFRRQLAEKRDSNDDTHS